MISFTHAALFVVGLMVGITQSDEINGTQYRTQVLDAVTYETEGDFQPDPYNVFPRPAAGDHYLGNKEAEYVIVGYVGLADPFTQRQWPTMNRVLDHYDGKVAYVMRHYPMPFHPSSQVGAEASECVAELKGEEAFWGFVEDVLESSSASSGGYSLSEYTKTAMAQGVDEQAFKTCMESDKHLEKIERSSRISERANIGTPMLLVFSKDGRRVGEIMGAFPFNETIDKLDDAMNKKGSND